MRRVLRTIVTVLVLAALLAAGGLLVRHKKEQLAAAPRPTERPTPVRTARAAAGALTDWRPFVGTVVAWQEAELAAELTARVEAIAVREGDAVTAGQLLVTLDDQTTRSDRGELEARIAQARAEVAAQEARVTALAETVGYWEKEVRREASLAGRGVVAQASADAKAERLNAARGEATAARRSLQAARKQVVSLEKRSSGVEARLGYTRIVAPFDGVVTRRGVDPGDLATPGRVLLVVEDQGRRKLTIPIPQEDAARVRQGTPARLAGDGERTLSVSRIYPSLNADRSLLVEVELAPGVAGAPGTWLRVDLALDRVTDATLVPEDALVETPDGGYAVFLVEDGVTRAQAVRLRLVRDGRAAVDGLAPGAEVVRSTYLGWNRLAGGERVEVIR